METAASNALPVAMRVVLVTMPSLMRVENAPAHLLGESKIVSVNNKLPHELSRALLSCRYGQS